HTQDILSKKEWCFALLLGLGTGAVFCSLLYLILKPQPTSTADLTYLNHLVHTLPASAFNPASFEPIQVRISFYSGLARENGGYEEMNALGGPLVVGSLAAPHDIPFGTTFIIDGLPADIPTNTFIVDDRGGAITRIDDTTIKVDVYVPRNTTESDDAYYTRVNDLGILYTTAHFQSPSPD
ncbi:MAG: hypothetical protein ACRDDX_16075, partial [Cellulosilyticaceae bacterium]